MHPSLILLGLLGTTGVGLIAVAPGLQNEVPMAPYTAAKNPRDEVRLYLTAQQAKAAAAQGMLPLDTRSILNVGKKMRHGDFFWDERDVPIGKVSIRINLDKQVLSVFRSGHEIGTSVILFGADGKDTPLGIFPVLTKIRDHHSRTYDAPMPFTLRLTQDGVAVHGSNVRWGAATHGCIGVPNEFAELLFEHAQLGDKVEIISSAGR